LTRELDRPLTKQPQHSDLIVVGGGVIGLSIAWLAARRGLTVRLFDARSVGRGASWAGAGILPPGATRPTRDPVEALRSLSHKLFPDWCQELQTATGIDPELRMDGGLYLARSPAETASLIAQETWWEGLGIEYQRLDSGALSDHFPVLASQPKSEASTTASPKKNLPSGWFLPQESRLRNPRYLRALIAACRISGVSLHEHEAVKGWQPIPDSRLQVETPKGLYQTAHLCISTGAWTALLDEPRLKATGIFPVRGQMVLYRLAQPPFFSVINEGHRYLVPRDDGHLLAGSCEEEVGFDERTSDSMIRSLQSWAEELAPVLRSHPPVQTWAGLRPGSIDGLPMIGTMPDQPNISIAAGHYRHGIHWSPATAEIIVNLVLGTPPPLDLAPYRLLRGKTYA
jgi:glycine oxidase